MAEFDIHQKRSLGFLIWIPLALLAVFIFIVVVVPDRRHWPPSWMERRTQREFVFTNIEAAGGWPAFKSECDFLISIARTNGQSQWFRGFGSKFDTFPDSCRIFTRLNPRQVDVYATGGKPGWMVIQVFGLHRTGGHDEPMYVLVYQQVTNSDECLASDLLGVIKLKPRKITDGVFEFY